MAFRREAHVPRGGPAGGDGGRGGDVVIEADPSLTTLLDLRYQRHYRAKNGQHGQGHQRYGRGGASRVIRVPCGTLIVDAEQGQLLGDLTKPGQQVVVAKGGRGGRGNLRFVSPTNRAPREAEPGQAGEQRRLHVVLKVVADVGLVGLPNVGKSTLLRRISAARPEVGDFPFTTLAPHLGVVNVDAEKSFVCADIPGIIEGAHRGMGLGQRFLRHIERTRFLLVLLDDRHQLGGGSGSPGNDFQVLKNELAKHDLPLDERPMVVVLNKCDLLSPTRIEEVRASFAQRETPFFALSAKTGEGMDALLRHLGQKIAQKGAQGGDLRPLTPKINE